MPMHKRILPILFAFTIISCNKPTSETTASESDTVAIAAPQQQGNSDGDHFVTQTDSTEEEIEEMIDTRSPVIDICGFSDDGKYFAFTQYITGEGGDGDAAIYIIDVAKNEWAAKPDVVEGYSSEMDQATINLRARNLPKYHITYQKNPGKEYVLTDNRSVTVNGREYTIDLQVRDLLIDLRVVGNGKEIILQKDKSLPKSRGSVREYRLAKAVTFNDKIAVFVEYDGELAEGFEGYRYFERKYIAVTGIIK